MNQNFVPASGGTEILKAGMIKHTNYNNYDFNLILSNPIISSIDYSKKNILWQHLNHTDESLLNMRNSDFILGIDAFIYVSHWQYEKFRYFYNTPLNKSYVIKNAIEPIEYVKRDSGEKIKLIYTSTPYRGLDILLKSFEILNRDDVELDIYSSTIIYGSDYDKIYSKHYVDLFEKAKTMKNVNYMGYATNQEIHKALQKAHIFAYPSIFEETCCLAMVEAAAAGCRLLSTSLGALYETGSEYARLLMLDDKIEKKFAKALNEEVENYWSQSNQDLLKEQSDFYNKYYSWEKRSQEWNTLFDKLS